MDNDQVPDYAFQMEAALKCAIIDDDPHWLDLVERGLDALGPNIESIKFSDGFDALNYLRQTAVDIVVTDCRMPSIDGFALVRELRRFDQATPVIMVSSDDSASNRMAGIGADAFVPKGAINDRLATTVEQLLQQKRRAEV